ncbi:MAG: right-handed parallel beta-helix repeat-containing protein [Gammaproteobacteria bacterium]|nr:right-handed parallel beta-helix repeat-containing protein [Gammaproteobacteria bacterium]
MGAGLTPHFRQKLRSYHKGVDAAIPVSQSRVGGAVSVQAAIDEAVLENKRVLIDGSFEYDVALNNFGGLLLSGAGMDSGSALRPVGCHGVHIANETSALAGRFQLRDFAIIGDDSGSWHGIFYEDNNTFPAFECNIENVKINDMGGKGIYLMTEFSNTLTNVHITRCGDHLFDLGGHKTTSLNNCYAHVVESGKVGYRIRTGCSMYNCNGIDAGGGDWGEFGSTVADDGVNGVSYMMLHGCNVEDFDAVGIVHKYAGMLVLQRCSFLAKAAGNFDYHIDDQATSGKVTLWIGHGTDFDSKGAVANGGPGTVDIKCASECAFMDKTGRDVTKDGVNTYSMPSLDVVGSSYLTSALRANTMRVGQFDGAMRYRGKRIHNTDSPYTIGDDDYLIRCRSSTGAITVTMPAAGNNERVVVVKDEDGSAGSNNITINRAGSDTIDGATSEVIDVDWGGRVFDDDGVSEWLVIGNVIGTMTSLTDNTGGTASDTIANLADGSVYANDHAALENAIASLAAKVNAILTRL